jgi:hypothetical protein
MTPRTITLSSFCECSRCRQCLPALKETADFEGTRRSSEQGHRGWWATSSLDLSELTPANSPGWLGTRQDDQEVRLQPYGVNFLIAGTSGSGKSTFALGFLERLTEPGYQFCIVDPEGDYQNLEGAVTLGDSKQATVK